MVADYAENEISASCKLGEVQTTLFTISRPLEKLIHAVCRMTKIAVMCRDQTAKWAREQAIKLAAFKY